MEANIENTNINDVHGCIQSNMIVLHNSKWDHDDENGHSVYVPNRFAINPREITAIEEKIYKDGSKKTIIYFTNRESETVWELFDEVMDLIDDWNTPSLYRKEKPLYD